MGPQEQLSPVYSRRWEKSPKNITYWKQL